MNRLKSFEAFNNIKDSLSARDYVEGNFLRLVQHFKIEDLTEEEQKQKLIDYFTRFPDQISRFNIQTVGPNRSQYNLSLNNIGGTIKYL